MLSRMGRGGYHALVGPATHFLGNGGFFDPKSSIFLDLRPPAWLTPRPFGPPIRSRALSSLSGYLGRQSFFPEPSRFMAFRATREVSCPSEHFSPATPAASAPMAFANATAPRVGRRSFRTVAVVDAYVWPSPLTRSKWSEVWPGRRQPRALRTFHLDDSGQLSFAVSCLLLLCPKSGADWTVRKWARG